MADLRNPNTPPEIFRKSLHLTAQRLALSTKKNLPADSDLLVVMRAGLGILPAFLDEYPGASVGFIDVDSQNEELAPATQLSSKIPRSMRDKDVIILEPVVAYAKAASIAIRSVVELNCRPHIASVVISKLAEQRLNDKDIGQAWTIAIDQMDHEGWLQPGIGDVGDRQWGEI